jgi:KaiC/GvpD/RAD55 family RecA-like ATPase/class 3 adenylate cyclase
MTEPATDRTMNPKFPIQIPGIVELVGSENEDGSKRSDRPVLAPSLFLLTGPSGVGKTVYCREFILNAIRHDLHVIFLTTSFSDRQFKMLLPAESAMGKLDQSVSFINPYIGSGISSPRDSSSHAANRLSLALAAIRELLSSKIAARVDDGSGGLAGTPSPTACVVVDSLTEFFLLFDEAAVIRFITELCLTLRQFDSTAILVLASPQASAPMIPSLSSLPNILAPFVDGILEMKSQEEPPSPSGDRKGSIARSIRLVSMKGIYHKPDWIQFRITGNGSIVFGKVSTILLNCTMCGKPISGTPVMDSDFAFDTKDCVETYRRLIGMYGADISDISGLPSQVVNMNFFFVDIVGLSNPAQSVKSQIEKIELLNKLIGSCDAYARNKETKIVLPTGDGMAIGFYSSVESPLLLSMQLHVKLLDYNANSFAEPKLEGERDKLGIRIGLGSGPVFIVNDIKGNQNVWGPGIILSRRVMDIGDNLHILLSGNMAEMLIALRDEYKRAIHPIGDYQIKHGQTIKIYSAFSDKFGNSVQPAKLAPQH